MKKSCKKIVSALIVTIILFTVAPITTSALTQNDIVNWMNSKNGTTINDGGTQCVAAFNSYLRLWGISNPISKYPVNYAYQIFNYNAPDGWQKISGSGNYQVGDVVIWNSSVGGGAGHVGMVYSTSDGTVKIFDQNYVAKNVCGIHNIAQTSAIRGVFRPPLNYGNNPTNPVDLGTDFYAYIINTYAWKHLTNDGPNVSMRSETGEANQVWKFDRQNDGSYIITNCVDGLVLDDHNFGTTDGTNVAVAGSNGSSAQRWYITGESGAYFLRAACGDLVLDIAGGSTDDGANVQMWTKNDSTAQKFQICKLNKPSQTHVHCAPGTNYVPTIIWWLQTEYTKYYDIKIWKGTVWEGDAYKILWGETGTSCEVNLPAGYYEAYVDTRNNFSTTMSNNVIKFTVTEDTPLNLGEDFYAALLVNKNWVNVSNINTNVELAENNHGSAEQIWHFMKQSDGSYIIVNCLDGKALDVCNAENDNGTNVQVHKINYSDAQKWYIYGRWSGEYYLKPKCSNKVLDVSGGNNVAGDNMQIWELNYTDAQKFAIWGVEPAGKSELSVESGSSLKNTCFSWTKSDNTNEFEVKVWKETSFDGEPFMTYNTSDTIWNVVLPAGNYKACVFSKNSFSSEQSNIVSFTVDYIDNVGDVNCDGVISISDATDLQKYLVNIVDFDDEQLAVADTNNDGNVNIEDATQIQKYVAEIIPSLG